MGKGVAGLIWPPFPTPEMPLTVPPKQFPVRRISFPVLLKQFPVIFCREFGCNRLKSLPYSVR